MTAPEPPAVLTGPDLIAPLRELIHNIHQFGEHWSWRCGVVYSKRSEGWLDGACQYDHVCGSWDELVQQGTAHLEKWHDIVLAPPSAAVPDTTQAREPDGATIARAFPAAEALAEAWWAPRHPGVGWADLPATVRDDYVQTAREWINAAQAVAGPSGDTVQTPESPTDSTPKAGRGGFGEAETTTDTVQAPDVAALRSYRDVERVCTGLGLTGWDGGWRNDHVTVYGPRGPEDEEDEVSVFGPHTEHVATVPMGAPAVVLDVWLRVLLAADTTPDRLAWISEAVETAAAERQARYQETACARRPAEERPDA